MSDSDAVKLKEMEIKIRGEFFADLAALQAETATLKKDIQGHGYKYADLTQTLEELKKLAPKFGFCFPSVGEVHNGKQVLSTIIGHRSGFFIKSDLLINPPATTTRKDKNGNLMDPPINDPQEIGTWWTYGRRYTEQGAFAIATEDVDGATGRNRGAAGRVNKAREGTTLTEQEGKMVYAKAMAAGWTATQLTDWLNENFGCTRTNGIPYEKLDKVCKFLDEQKLPSRQSVTD